MIKDGIVCWKMLQESLFSEESPRNPFAIKKREVKENAHNPISLKDKYAGITLKDSKNQDEVKYLFSITIYTLCFLTSNRINAKETTPSTAPMSPKKSNVNLTHLCFPRSSMLYFNSFILILL